MFPDPLLWRLREIGFPWWGLWITVSLAFNLLTWILQKITKTDFDNSDERRMGRVIWPWLIFGPVAGAYMIIADTGERIESGLASVGYFYKDYSLFSIADHQVFDCILQISVFLTLFVVFRYIRRGEPKWIVEPRIISFTYALLVNIPMTVMALATVARLLDHWWVLYRFALLGWKPEIYYSADGMYGLGWSHTAIVTESLVALLLSLVPLLMLLRDSGEYYSKTYLALTIGGLIYLGSYFLVLIPSFDRLFGEINTHFLNGTISSFSQYFDIAKLDSMERIYQETILARRIDDINKLPSDFGINLFRILGSLFTLAAASVVNMVLTEPESRISFSKFNEWFQGIMRGLRNFSLFT